MLKCDDFLGCFAACDENIPTGISPVSTGEYTYEFTFNNVLIKNTVMVEDQGEIILPNVFPFGIIHCVKITDPEGVKIKSISFKIHTQCS